VRNRLKVPWAQWQRSRIAELEAENAELVRKLERAEHRVHEARVQRDGWQELAHRLLTRIGKRDAA